MKTLFAVILSLIVLSAHAQDHVETRREHRKRVREIKRNHYDLKIDTLKGVRYKKMGRKTNIVFVTFAAFSIGYVFGPLVWDEYTKYSQRKRSY